MSCLQGGKRRGHRHSVDTSFVSGSQFTGLNWAVVSPGHLHYKATTMPGARENPEMIAALQLVWLAA